MRRSGGFDRRAVRSSLGLDDADIAIVFAALGHFERSGCRQMAFVGMQDDVRPFVWAGDIFALPSAYEVVPLAAMIWVGALRGRV